MKRLFLGMLMVAILVVPAAATSDSEPMTMTIAQYCSVSINNWVTDYHIEDTSVGRNTALGIALNDPIYLFGYDDRTTPATVAAVAIDINAPATAKAHVTGNVLTGTATAHTLVAGALLGAGTTATPPSYPGCVGEVGDNVAYPLRLDYSGTTAPADQPGYNGPGLAVEVARSIYDRADAYTGTVTVTVTFD